MATVTIEEAQRSLPELIHRLAPGEEMVILENNEPIARLRSSTARKPSPRKLGSLRGSILYTAPDFDAPLEDFKEYT